MRRPVPTTKENPMKTDASMTPRERTAARSKMLIERLAQTTPSEWLLTELAHMGGEAEVHVLRARLLALLPRGEQDPEAAEQVIATALAGLPADSVHLAERGSAALIRTGKRPTQDDLIAAGADPRLFWGEPGEPKSEPTSIDLDRLRSWAEAKEAKEDRAAAVSERKEAKAARAAAMVERFKARREAVESQSRVLPPKSPRAPYVDPKTGRTYRYPEGR